jgi:4-aminobutyrate aminotransferase-like enzyme
VRLLAPLTIQDSILEEGLALLADSLREAFGQESARAVA